MICLSLCNMNSSAYGGMGLPHRRALFLSHWLWTSSLLIANILFNYDLCGAMTDDQLCLNADLINSYPSRGQVYLSIFF